MGIMAITAEDTLTLYNRVFNDMADGDVSNITFPNNLIEMKTGKNRNTVFSKNATGENAELELRLIRGSSDDQFLQSKIAVSERDFVSTELAAGEFVIRVGDGQGNVVRDVFTLAGGVIVKKVEGKENVEGDTTQGVAMYHMKFATVTRSIQ